MGVSRGFLSRRAEQKVSSLRSDGMGSGSGRCSRSGPTSQPDRHAQPGPEVHFKKFAPQRASVCASRSQGLLPCCHSQWQSRSYTGMY